MSSIQYLIGKSLGKYEVLEHLGHGGMSEVYKGQQAQLARMVAIKVLHPFLADEEGFVVRFQREARIVATMRHPNIVQVYDFDYNTDLAVYYMVMEYIDGPTLKDLLETDRCSPEETIRIGAAVADALDYAHQRSMVHRDIKPANIMFLDKDQPVLTDFGIAKMLTLSGLTASGAMVGTPAYMAPEIGLGQAGTAASDIYSLSVVLYQAVTGALPFTAETPMGMVMQHINKAPLRPSAYLPDVPATLEAVIMRGLEKTPADRFATAGEMAQALRLAYAQVAGSASMSPLTPPTIAVDPERLAPTAMPVSETDEAPVPTPSETAHDVGVLTDNTTHETDGPATPPPPADLIPQDETAPRRRRRVLPRILVRGIVLILAVLLVTGGIWYSAQGSMPPRIRNLLTANSVAAPATLEATTPAPAEATATPPVTAEAPTPSPEPAATTDLVVAAPPPTATPAPCTRRVVIDGVRIRPDDVAAPNAAIAAFVSVRNSGSCPWPPNTTFDLVAGTPLSGPVSFPATTLAPRETMHFLIPMTTPEEFGVYDVIWELRVGDEPLGRGESGLVEFQITVDDVETEGLASAAITVPEAPTQIPLVVEPPALRTWETLPSQALWRGTVAITVTGGTGTYRIFRDRISPETEVVGGELDFAWRICRPYPLDLWILSGEETLNWRDSVTPPRSPGCP